VSAYEACAAETHLRMCTDEGIATEWGGGGREMPSKIQKRAHLCPREVYQM